MLVGNRCLCNHARQTDCPEMSHQSGLSKSVRVVLPGFGPNAKPDGVVLAMSVDYRSLIRATKLAVLVGVDLPRPRQSLNAAPCRCVLTHWSIDITLVYSGCRPRFANHWRPKRLANWPPLAKAEMVAKLPVAVLGFVRFAHCHWLITRLMQSRINPLALGWTNQGVCQSHWLTSLSGRTRLVERRVASRQTLWLNPVLFG